MNRQREVYHCLMDIFSSSVEWVWMGSCCLTRSWFQHGFSTWSWSQLYRFLQVCVLTHKGSSHILQQGGVLLLSL